MNRYANFLIPILIAILTVAVWALLNRPANEPPWPAVMQGVSFSPMRADDDPSHQRFPDAQSIDADLALLEGRTHAIRTYTLQSTLTEVSGLAAKHGLNVTLGAWISDNHNDNEQELQRLKSVLAQNHQNIVRVMVGNEALLREDVKPQELFNYLDRVRGFTWLPVSTAEPWHVWLKYPELAKHVDFITIHLLPYWEGIPIEQAVDYCIHRYDEVKAAFPDKQIVIGEVGWPSNGRTNRGAEASLPNQTRFLRRFLQAAEAQQYVYYVMEAFDQRWKARTEGAVGAYWGIYDSERQPKFAFSEPVVRIPGWHELAAFSVGGGILLLIFLYRDSATLAKRGKSFLALITYAITTAAAWIIYDYTRQYMTPTSVAIGLVLLLGGCGVILLLMAEAHEWAESLWLNRWRRPFPLRQVPDGQLPLVSIHVPAYNEPPQLLRATLDGLAALDYPRFEVLVIDNNTKDPAVWEPVRDYCAQLGPRFRFFHVAPLAGYKAGALNFALRHTDPHAEVVAVIDADYIVDRNWLKHLAPAFADPEVAIVQAPQDYRDADENAFKAMCMAEYRGFFNLGMVTRNERNAIIQHGTMTMMRRARLEAVGGWAEWCITEDAELGMRLFEAGDKALYIPHTYGRGLMPDTFADFRKQRYRWAYGAVRIMLHHRQALLGLRKTSLSAGQRYHFIAGWLPWFADGFNLLFNFAALGWTVAMVVSPLYITPPFMSIAMIPLVVFVFKIAKSLLLYRHRVTSSWRQITAAGLAGLALSHTIARAMFGGLISGRLGFFRTPKMASGAAVWRALADAREEALLAFAFLFGAFAIMQRDDAYMLDVRLWMLVLLVQSIPYLAAVAVSLISTRQQLPASLVGVMEPMTHDDPTAQTSTQKHCQTIKK